MTIVPVRFRSVLFLETLNVTMPDPLPDAPDVTVIHSAWLTAVHEQPAAVVTLTVRLVAPLRPTLISSGLIEELHVGAGGGPGAGGPGGGLGGGGVGTGGGGAASWRTVRRRELTTISPCRVCGVGFPAATNVTW